MGEALAPGIFTQLLLASRRCHCKVASDAVLAARLTVRVEPVVVFPGMSTLGGSFTVKPVSPVLAPQEPPSMTVRFTLSAAEPAPGAKATVALPETSDRKSRGE